MDVQRQRPAPTPAIDLEIAVPGPPDEVWAAVATGPGITSWFVPAQVEEREGGAITLTFGPGMDEAGRVTAWDPPRRFAYAGAPDRGGLTFDWQIEDDPSGGCRVRLRNGGFADGADGDRDRRGMEAGWRLFLENLRLVRTHFPGRPAATMLVNGRADGPRAEALARMLAALGLPRAPAAGDRVEASADGAPALGGTVERVADGMVTLLVDRPARGIVFLAAEGGGEQVFTSVYAYLFGEGAAGVVAAEEPRWREWMERSAPAGGAP